MMDKIDNAMIFRYFKIAPYVDKKYKFCYIKKRLLQPEQEEKGLWETQDIV